MKARRLIGGTSFGPDTLKVVGEAFDQAWAEIAGSFGSTQVENARLRLAEAILSIATEHSTDVSALKAGPSGDGAGLPLGHSAYNVAPYANEPSFAETIRPPICSPRSTWERSDATLLLPHQKRSADNPGY